jgi:hypothetical protein
MRLKRRLTDEALEQQHESVREYPYTLSTIRDEFRRESILNSLPPQALSKYRVLVILKFLFFTALVIEVIVLQK